MKKIAVQLKKSFSHGFVLSEQEATRIDSLIREQLVKASKQTAPKFVYSIKFKNGIIAEETEFKKVFELDNSGSDKITDLMMVGTIDEKGNEHSIKLSFHDNENTDYDRDPIRLEVQGKLRDWVFVALSSLEERIEKVKRRGFRRMKSLFAGSLVFSVAGLLMIFLMATGLTKNSGYVSDIEKKWEAGLLSDPIEAQILLKKGELASYKLGPIMMKAFLIPIAVVVAIYILLRLYRIWYQLYVFNWGENILAFERKERQRKTFFIVVIVGLVISIVGGLIANYLGAIKLF